MKLLRFALVGVVAGFMLFVGKPAYAVYTQTVIAEGGQAFSGAKISFTTSTGETGQVQQDPNDNNKIMILLPDGTKGSSGTLTVTRGGKTSTIAINNLSSGSVMVNLGTGMASAGRSRLSNRYDLSVALFATIGQGFYNGNVDDGWGHLNDDLAILKFGVGAAGRIGFPGDWPLWYPMFLDVAFTSYPNGPDDRARTAGDSYLNIQENWRTSVMFGITPWQFQALKISLMAGIAVIESEVRVDFGNAVRDGRTRVQVVPAFGFEFATPLGALANIANMANIANTGRPIWFMGGTLDVLREVRVNGGNQGTADGMLQYQLLTGIRFPF